MPNIIQSLIQIDSIEDVQNEIEEHLEKVFLPGILQSREIYVTTAIFKGSIDLAKGIETVKWWGNGEDKKTATPGLGKAIYDLPFDEREAMLDALRKWHENNSEFIEQLYNFLTHNFDDEENFIIQNLKLTSSYSDKNDSEINVIAKQRILAIKNLQEITKANLDAIIKLQKDMHLLTIEKDHTHSELTHKIGERAKTRSDTLKAKIQKREKKATRIEIVLSTYFHKDREKLLLFAQKDEEKQEYLHSCLDELYFQHVLFEDKKKRLETKRSRLIALESGISAAEDKITKLKQSGKTDDSPFVAGTVALLEQDKKALIDIKHELKSLPSELKTIDTKIGRIIGKISPLTTGEDVSALIADYFKGQQASDDSIVEDQRAAQDEMAKIMGGGKKFKYYPLQNTVAFKIVEISMAACEHLGIDFDRSIPRDKQKEFTAEVRSLIDSDPSINGVFGFEHHGKAFSYVSLICSLREQYIARHGDINDDDFIVPENMQQIAIDEGYDLDAFNDALQGEVTGFNLVQVDEFTQIPQDTSAEVFTQIVDCFQEYFTNKEHLKGKPLFLLKSIGALSEICLAIEQKHGYKVNPDDLSQNYTLIEKQSNSSSPSSFSASLPSLSISLASSSTPAASSSTPAASSSTPAASSSTPAASSSTPAASSSTPAAEAKGSDIELSPEEIKAENERRERLKRELVQDLNASTHARNEKRGDELCAVFAESCDDFRITQLTITNKLGIPSLGIKDDSPLAIDNMRDKMLVTLDEIVLSISQARNSLERIHSDREELAVYIEEDIDVAVDEVDIEIMVGNALRYHSTDIISAKRLELASTIIDQDDSVFENSLLDLPDDLTNALRSLRDLITIEIEKLDVDLRDKITQMRVYIDTLLQLEIQLIREKSQQYSDMYRTKYTTSPFDRRPLPIKLPVKTSQVSSSISTSIASRVLDSKFENIIRRIEEELIKLNYQLTREIQNYEVLKQREAEQLGSGKSTIPGIDDSRTAGNELKKKKKEALLKQKEKEESKAKLQKPR